MLSIIFRLHCRKKNREKHILKTLNLLGGDLVGRDLIQKSFNANSGHTNVGRRGNAALS